MTDSAGAASAWRWTAALPYVVVGLVGVVHRLGLFLLHRGDLDALIDANPGWYTFQQLPMEVLRDHFLRAMLYLQQTPPIPNVVMAVVVKSVAWPHAASYALIGLHALTSLLTAMVLLHLLSAVYPDRPLFRTAIGIVFVLNADLVVLEYNSFGQTLYEGLAMLLVLGVVDALVVFHRSARWQHAVLAGVLTAALVLTRATWSLFPLLGAGLVAGLARTGRGRMVAAYLVPVVVLQGGWVAKNWAVYGYLSPMTSSYGGVSLSAGMRNAGFGAEFQRFGSERVTAENGYADWEVALMQGDARVLERLRAGDRELERVMGFPNPWLNLTSTHALSRVTQRVFVEFVWRHPRVMLVKWVRAYRVFWQPIAAYGRAFVALFSGGGRVGSGLDVVDVMRQVRAGTLPGPHELQSGTCMLTSARKHPCRSSTATMYTLRSLEPFLLALNVVGVNVLMPLALLIGLVRLDRYDAAARDGSRVVVLAVAAVTCAYFVALVNLVETAENNRFRVEVEPVLWLVTLLSVTVLAGVARRLATGRRSSDG